MCLYAEVSRQLAQSKGEAKNEGEGFGPPPVCAHLKGLSEESVLFRAVESEAQWHVVMPVLNRQG